MIDRSAGYQIRHYWGPGWRCLIFLLGSLSIGCLLSDFYKLCPMRVFTPFVFVPGLVVLLALAMHDLQSGDGELCRAVLTGLVGGLFAAVAYDLFRLPFVFSREWKLASIITCGTLAGAVVSGTKTVIALLATFRSAPIGISAS